MADSCASARQDQGVNILSPVKHFGNRIGSAAAAAGESFASHYDTRRQCGINSCFVQEQICISQSSCMYIKYDNQRQS